jgi:hypothetical protein
VVEQAPPPAPEVNVIVVKKPKRSAAKRSDAVQKPASAPAAKSNKVEIIKGTSRSNEDL